jgi:hypothetical protein
MIVVIGLLALIATVVLAAASVGTNGSSTQPLSDNFVISGQHLNGLFTRQQVLYGIAVRLVDLLRSGNLETPARVCPSRRRRQTAVIYETRQLGLGKQGNPGCHAGQGQGTPRPGAVRESWATRQGRHQNERS